jgi:hypothetical protein
MWCHCILKQPGDILQINNKKTAKPNQGDQAIFFTAEERREGFRNILGGKKLNRKYRTTQHLAQIRTKKKSGFQLTADGPCTLVFQFCIPQAHVSRNFYKAVLYKGR